MIVFGDCDATTRLGSAALIAEIMAMEDAQRSSEKIIRVSQPASIEEYVIGSTGKV